MANNKFMGTFESQGDVLSKIEDLKMQGISENSMYVMAQGKEQLSLVRGKTDVDYKTADGDWMDKFMSFLSGADATREAISRMGIDERETERYYKDVQNGKILLFVDNQLNEQYEEEQTTGFASTPRDEIIAGSGLMSDPNSTIDGERYTSNDYQINEEPRGVQESLPTDSDEQSLQLHEERLNVDKERVQTGEVNVGKHVIEENQRMEVPIEREEVFIERREVNQEADGRDTEAFQDTDGIHIPVSEERVEVNKKDVVREEIIVGKRRVQDTETINETVRREEADIDEDTKEFPKYDDKNGPINL